MSRLDHPTQAEADRRVPQPTTPRLNLDWAGHAGGVRLVSLTAARALRHLAANPGASGAEVRHGAGVRHDSQISGLLARLERDGLTARRRRGRANAWTLTRRGERLLGGLPEEAYLPHDVGLVDE